MISIRDIVENLPAHIVYAAEGSQDAGIDAVVAGDLMSDILVSVDTDCLLITSLATEQAVRTADIVCASVVLLVNDKLPVPAMRSVAEDCGITLLATPLPMYETCAEIARLLAIHG